MNFDQEIEEIEEQIEFFLETDLPQPKKRMRGKRKSSFNISEKKKLALLVEQHPSIWSLEDKKHINLDAVSSDWREIALELGKSVDDCKSMWKSLRDSHRYHNVPRKIGKSGSAASEDYLDEVGSLLPNDNADWEFSECLAFLKPASSKRKTYSSAMPSSAPLVVENSDSDQIDQNEVVLSAKSWSNSSYTYNTSKPQKKDVMAENVSNLTQTVADLIQMRKDQNETSKDHQLENHSLLANLDRILKKLPDDVVEELGLSFQQQAVHALRKHQNNVASSSSSPAIEKM